MICQEMEEISLWGFENNTFSTLYPLILAQCLCLQRLGKTKGKERERGRKKQSFCVRWNMGSRNGQEVVPARVVPEKLYHLDMTALEMFHCPQLFVTCFHMNGFPPLSQWSSQLHFDVRWRLIFSSPIISYPFHSLQVPAISSSSLLSAHGPVSYFTQKNRNAPGSFLHGFSSLDAHCWLS